MDKNRSGRLSEREFNAHEILSQVTILHHTDPLLARKVTRAVLLEKAARGDFREPRLGLKPTKDGVIHVSV